MKRDKINCKSLSGPHRPMTAPHGSVTAPHSPVTVLSRGDATSSCWMSPFVKKIQRDLTIIPSPREHLDNFHVTDDRQLPVERSTAECPKPRETMHHGIDKEKKPPDLPLFNLETNVGHQVAVAGCGNHAEKHEKMSAYSDIEESCAPHTQTFTTVDFRSSSSRGINVWGSGHTPLSLYIWLRNGSVLIHCYQSWTMDMLNMGVRAWHIYSYRNNEDPSWGQDFSQDVLRFEQVQDSKWAQKLELTHTQNSCAYDFRNSHNEYVFDLCTGLHGGYGHTRCGTSNNLNNNSSTKGLDLFASEDISVGETRLKTGDLECLGARKMEKFQNKLPPLMLYRKKAEVTKKLAMKKIIRLENLPVLPMFAGIKDILNTGDSESVHAIVSGSQSSKSSQGDESGKPDSTVSSESSAQTKSDAESIGSNTGRSPKKKSLGRDKSVERCPSEVSADGPRKFKARPSKMGSAKKGAKSQETGQRNPCMIGSLSEVVIGDVSEYVYSQMQGQEKSTGVDDDDDDDDEDDDSESESDTESEDEDVQSNDYVVLDSSTNMVPWFLRTTVSTEPYVGLEEFFDGYVDDDDDDGGSSNNESPKKKKSPTCTSLSTPVIKRNKVSGGTTTQNGRKAVGSGGSNGSGKGKGECTETGGAKGGSDGKKEKSSEQSGGGGDESSGKDDSSGSGGGKKGNKPPPCTLPTNMQPTFYVSGGNNSILVEGPLLELGWKKTTDRHDERYRLKWVENRCRINYIAFREGEQLVNHIPNCKLLTNKLGLLCSLQEYERVTLLTKGRLPRLKMADFVPETYKLDERIDRDRFLSEYKEGETWICKPTSLNQGKGIFLLRSREEINQLLTEREAKSSWTRQVQMRIVQRYIHNPLLIEGRKFDIRAYMFIASTVPFLVLFHNGYVRLSCQKYSQDDTNLTTHLTNQFVQKKDPTYKDNKEDTAWTMEKLNEYINQTIGKEKNMDKDWVFGGLTKQMQRITLHCFNSVKHKLQCKIGYFDLYGMDFMVDSDLKVWLIEINANPALWTNCQALKEAIPRVVRDALYLAIECFDKSRKGQALLPLHSLGGYNVLYCGSNVANGQRQIRSVSPFKDSVDMSRPTGTSPPQNQRRHSPPRVISKTNISGSSQSSQGLVSPPVSSSKLEKKPSSVLPTINIGANVNMTRPGPTGGYSYSKKQQTYEPQQQISRVSMSGSASGEDHKLRMTQADSGSRRSKENRGH
ncbi:unnamed protein product [Lymnaea stagnalis]|uniref:Uncharacterized protein n=1 Tax=Lymnaea stagnalis TaxID=6523 RepID=A0AAV2I5N7_LYMST